MKVKLLFSMLFLLATFPSCAVEKSFSENQILLPTPVREFRGAWLATVANIDWPSKPGLPVAQQKTELISLLDRAAQLHFNAVFFQVRTVSDAFYESPFEPWSEYLTGIQGQAPRPFYDPLNFAINEAHQRGLQLYAWFNPFRAGHPEAKSPAAANHLTRTHPVLIRHYGNQTLLDPGEPQTQLHVVNVMLDVVKRYEIDGVVIDDYFYPYPQKNSAKEEIDFPDDASWKKYGLKSGLSRADWRRDNVNRFVKKLTVGIHTLKPQIAFGISPFGIWRPKNPPQINGMDAYEKIYADARKWLASGWVDFLAPQLYWKISDTEHSFPALLNWWRTQNVLNRHIWPALADFNVGSKFSTTEISQQIQIVREKSDAGTVHYHLRSILENPALATSIRNQFSTPALLPLNSWLPAATNATPKISVGTSHDSAQISWRNGSGEPARWWLLQSREHDHWQTEVFPANRTEFFLNHATPEIIAIRAVSRTGRLSDAAIWSRK